MTARPATTPRWPAVTETGVARPSSADRPERPRTARNQCGVRAPCARCSRVDRATPPPGWHVDRIDVAREVTMPTPTEILAGLTRIANDAFGLAVAWHLAIAVALVALAAGWRPSRRLAGALLALPAASASALAFGFGNPFNGAMFAALAAALLGLALRLDGRAAGTGPTWATAIGAAMILFGWVYPHFLVDKPALAYLYGAPTGLVPCPTLSLTIGFALVAGGLGSRAWSLTLAAAGLFYGAFGAARLGVTLDIGLLAGAIGLALLVVRPQSSPARTGAGLGAVR
jgi:hypothetical protein